MGNEAFFTFLKDYVGEFTHKIASADDFFDLLGAYNREDLTPVIEEYFSNR
ncbi:MAG: hypothetical protein P8Y03_31145 [Anaerolineales bacterium]